MTSVFIPTRNRRELLAKTLPKWRQQRVHEIILMVEPQEYSETRRFVRDLGIRTVHTMKLPENNRGINYSRHQIVELADLWGYPRIIMSDDDIYPKPDTDVNRLYEWDDINTLGIGIMVPFYGLMFGNQTIKDEDRPLMTKGALGKRLFSLNIPRVMAIGNFDTSLHSGWGDDELVRQGMKDLQATWYVHAGVNGVSIAGRYTKGGLNDLHGESQERRAIAQEHSHRVIFARWGPRYVSDPTKRMLFKWKVFMDDNVPGWEKRIDWTKK